MWCFKLVALVVQSSLISPCNCLRLTAGVQSNKLMKQSLFSADMRYLYYQVLHIRDPISSIKNMTDIRGAGRRMSGRKSD